MVQEGKGSPRCWCLEKQEENLGLILLLVLDRRDKQPRLYGKDLQQDTQLQLTDSLP